MEILTLLAPVILKLMDLYLDKIAKDKEMRKKFLELVDEMGSRGIISTKLRKKYYEKKKRLEGIA